jgi:hyaluronan synthase
MKLMNIKKLNETVNKLASSIDLLLFISTFVIIFNATFGLYFFRHDFKELHFNLTSTSIGFFLFLFSSTFLAFRMGFFSFIFYNFKKYQPIPSVSDEMLPNCTVIVPAYNEGRLVYDTLQSIANCNYPKEKIQLISIDDGSADDTWQWMQKAKEEIGDLLTIYQQPQNAGKRQALYRGFQMATGEVFVTIDSDSIVSNDALRNMVSPIIVDTNCGAVAGNIKVLNTEDTIIPKMLNVSFAFSFEFIRSAQSHLGSVLCTPGALAAYKREAVMACLPEWINQTFLGVKTDIGEDRAMTNMILKQGYHVLFQKNAEVFTNVPESYDGLRKMFTRWERSNVRENLMLTKFAFTKFREGDRNGARMLLLNQWVGMLTAYHAFITMIVFLVLHPALFLTSTVFSIFLFTSIPAIFYALRHDVKQSFWAYTYGLFYSFGLFWIAPYAIATARKRGWLTRG